MALIKCPECKKKVSDQCGRCPNCGFPIEVVEKSITASNGNTIDTDIVVEKETEQSPKERKQINKKLLIGIISAAVGEAVVEELRPVRERFDTFIADKKQLEDIYHEGSEKAEYYVR